MHIPYKLYYGNKSIVEIFVPAHANKAYRTCLKCHMLEMFGLSLRMEMRLIMLRGICHHNTFHTSKENVHLTTTGQLVTTCQVVAYPAQGAKNPAGLLQNGKRNCAQVIGWVYLLEGFVKYTYVCTKSNCFKKQFSRIPFNSQLF